MKTTLTAIALALALGGPVSAQAVVSDGDMISMGHSMLVAQVSNGLDRQGIPTAGIDNLTLNEIVRLSRILQDNDDRSVSEMRSQATHLLETAQAR